MVEYIDRHGNVWRVSMERPDPTPIHEGLSTFHWQMWIGSPDGGSVVHGHQNLAEAIAEAVAKADWLHRSE